MRDKLYICHPIEKMSEHWEIYADWNPWHGCTKISPGCKYCYVYRYEWKDSDYHD